MPGLAPGIHVLGLAREDADGEANPAMTRWSW